MTSLRMAAVGMIGLFLTGCQHTGPSIQVVGPSEVAANRPITVASGVPTKIAFTTALNPDCTRASDVGTTRIVRAPANGRLTLKEAEDYPTYVKSNPRYVCNSRRVAGRTLTYKSAAGFVGNDYFEYDQFVPGGVLLHMKVNVQVR